MSNIHREGRDVFTKDIFPNLLKRADRFPKCQDGEKCYMQFSEDTKLLWLRGAIKTLLTRLFCICTCDSTMHAAIVQRERILF